MHDDSREARMLLMKKEFFEAIRTGRKTTTFRYWLRRMVAPDSVHTIRGLGRVRITTVEAVDARDIRDADAQADGFDTAEALMASLDELYPPQDRPGRQLYHVSFAFLGDND